MKKFKIVAAMPENKYRKAYAQNHCYVNDEKELREKTESLSSEYPEAYVYVVNTGSSDGSVEMVYHDLVEVPMSEAPPYEGFDSTVRSEVARNVDDNDFEYRKECDLWNVTYDNPNGSFKDINIWFIDPNKADKVAKGISKIHPELVIKVGMGARFRRMYKGGEVFKDFPDYEAHFIDDGSDYFKSQKYIWDSYK